MSTNEWWCIEAFFGTTAVWHVVPGGRDADDPTAVQLWVDCDGGGWVLGANECRRELRVPTCQRCLSSILAAPTQGGEWLWAAVDPPSELRVTLHPEDSTVTFVAGGAVDEEQVTLLLADARRLARWLLDQRGGG